MTHNPDTDCRELILHALQQQGEVAWVIDAVLLVANRQDDKHYASTPSHGQDQWSYSLGEYLKWARSQKGLDAATVRKVDEAIDKVTSIRG